MYTIKTITKPSTLIIRRMLKKTKRDQATGCIVWQGALSDKGYGWFRYGQHIHKAHRVAFAAYHGITLTGKYPIDHTCENKACVNPHHLQLVTDLENKRRAVARRAARREQKVA